MLKAVCEVVAIVREPIMVVDAPSPCMVVVEVWPTYSGPPTDSMVVDEFAPKIWSADHVFE